MLFAEMGDDGVREVDPATDLYPFVVLASGDISGLSAVFFMLRRDPSLAFNGVPSLSSDCGVRKQKKRKR